MTLFISAHTRNIRQNRHRRLATNILQQYLYRTRDRSRTSGNAIVEKSATTVTQFQIFEKNKWESLIEHVRREKCTNGPIVPHPMNAIGFEEYDTENNNKCCWQYYSAGIIASAR